MKSQPAAVKPLLTEAALWLGGGIVLTTLLWASGLDTNLAQSLYNPNSSIAHAIRNFGNLPGGLFVATCLVFSLLPGLAKRFPLTRTTAVLVVLTSLLAGGLVNQVLVQNAVNRPRPRESVLLANPAAIPDDQLSGNSMPSGHAAMGFVFAVPFFPLRRKKPFLAKAFLATGLAAGTAVGLGRMVLGAHFASDVLMAGAIEMAGAVLLTAAFLRWKAPSPAIMATLTAFALAALVLGNSFTATLTYQAKEPFNSLKLPCIVETIPGSPAQPPTLTVQVSGHGAPLSTLALTRTGQNNITLRTWLGVYWGLQCRGTLAMPTLE